MNAATLSTFLIYLAAVLLIGFMAYRVTGNLSDYILGGRRLNAYVTALSAGASDMSGWLLLGLPGAVYAAGFNQIWIAVGLSIGAYINWQFIAGRLRHATERAKDSITLPDFFENRFEDKSRLLRVVSAVVILLFFTIYTSSGLVAGAKLFKGSFGMDYETALWIGTAAMVAYTFLGGFLAVSWTDFLQGTLMFIALIVAPIVAIDHLGGWQATLDRVGTLSTSHLDAFHEITVIGAISLMAWGLGYFGQPHILARFMAARSVSAVPRARFVGMWWMVLGLYGAVFTGFAAFALFADNPLADPEQAFIQLTQFLFNPWIAGVLLAGILAAVMSTVDSQLLVSSSGLTEDFYRALFKTEAGDRELVWIGRIAVVVIALIALTIAYDENSSVLSLVAYAWGGFGAAFGPVVILSLFWRRMTRNGALAGLIAGALTVVVWRNLSGGLFEVYEILPGFILALLAIILVSLAGPPAPKSIQKHAERI